MVELRGFKPLTSAMQAPCALTAPLAVLRGLMKPTLPPPRAALFPLTYVRPAARTPRPTGDCPSSCQRSRPSQLHGRAAERVVGGRHHLPADVGRLSLPRGRSQRLVARSGEVDEFVNPISLTTHPLPLSRSQIEKAQFSAPKADGRTAAFCVFGAAVRRQLASQSESLSR
jgi:hypothetical protein